MVIPTRDSVSLFLPFLRIAYILIQHDPGFLPSFPWSLILEGSKSCLSSPLGAAKSSPPYYGSRRHFALFLSLSSYNFKSHVPTITTELFLVFNDTWSLSNTMQSTVYSKRYSLSPMWMVFRQWMIEITFSWAYEQYTTSRKNMYSIYRRDVIGISRISILEHGKPALTKNRLRVNKDSVNIVFQSC